MPKSRIKSYLLKLYYLYTYNTPVGLMTFNEAVVFNCVVLLVISFLMYWVIVVLPVLSVRLVETTYYCLTGNTVSFGVAASLYLSRRLFLPTSAAIPQHGSNLTRIGRAKFAL